MPPDSPLSPRSPVGERPERMVPSHYQPNSRSSLLESQPFPRGSLKKAASMEEKVRPFDLSDLGLSDRTAARNRGSYPGGHPNLWNSTDKCYNNPDSLFSCSSHPADEQFHGKSAWHSNNWVNFLDASNMNGGPVTSNKTMAEIWDAGKSPLDSDGWSVYPPAVPPGQPVSSEADAVDALFSQMPADWSGTGAGAGSAPESPFSTQEVSWTPPPDVSSIWGSGYLVPGSTAEPLPTSSAASFVSYPVQPQRNQDSPVQPSFEPLGSLGSSIWNPSGAPSTWSPTSE